jgi:hypothetical protein
MYEKPELQRLGSMREITLGGGAQFVDPLGPDGSGCQPHASITGALECFPTVS